MKDASSLRYYISISVDYHQRRTAFFDWWHKFTTAAGIVLGSGAAVVILSEFDSRTAALAAFMIAVLNAIELVFGVSAKARDHSDLRHRYIELENAFEENPDSDEHLKKIWTLKGEIDSDEPPPKKIVVQMSANAYCYATGNSEHEVPIPFWKRWLAHYVDFELPRPSLPQGSL